MEKNRLFKKYNEEISKELLKQLKLENIMQVPRVQKIIVNSGIGSIKDNREFVDLFTEELASLSGQKPSVRKSRLSVASFKIRKGDPVGIAVTLRNDKMWAFLDKLINIVLPKVRDFGGVSPTSFDRLGNYSLGIKEHTIFPEVNPNIVKATRSLEVTIVMSSPNTNENKLLLEMLGMPFRKDTK